MYKTREFIEPLCERINQTSSALQLTYEIILVDDSCPENSAETAEAISSRYPLKIIRLPQNMGQDNALKAGMRVCQSPWLVIIDGDLQDPPEAVRDLRQAAAGYEVVFARRTGDYESTGRLATSKCYRLLMRLLGGLPPGAGLFALLSRPVYQHIAEGPQNISVLAAIVRYNGRYTSVPILRAKREAGFSAYSSAMRIRKALTSLFQIIILRLTSSHD